MFGASYARGIWGVRTGALVSSTPLPRPTQDSGKPIHISRSLQSLQKTITGERGQTKPISTGEALPLPAQESPSKLSTLSFLLCWGVTHIRHDAPLSPAGSRSTPEKETPGDSPVKIPSRPTATLASGKNPRLQEWRTPKGARVPGHRHASAHSTSPAPWIEVPSEGEGASTPLPAQRPRHPRAQA